ncbi:MAG: hypothetical protein JNL66_25455 [Alphaproteobacteria bacterium]|nr:hypothetical protein [Alphaproteobacteria bacterium]
MAESKTPQSPFDGFAQLFGDGTALRSTLNAQADGFWRTQGEILGNLQTLSRAWFERRRAGTEAAMETAQTMCSCGNPADAALAYQRWLAGSMERLTADAVETQAQMIKLSQAWIEGLRGAATAYDAQARASGPAAGPAGDDAASREQPRGPGRRAA